VIRIQNHDSESVVLRERHIKIFSLNNLTQVTAQGVLGEFPTLSPENPAYQFSSTIDLPQRKGGHMWGKLTIQRGDASTFDVDIPTVVLEAQEVSSGQSSENVIH
jgi:polymerase delta-interacting protein 2